MRRWKDYHAGAGGAFMYKVQVERTGSGKLQIACLRAKDSGSFGSADGFFHKVQTSSACGRSCDRRRQVEWGSCDPSDGNALWRVHKTGTIIGSNYEQLESVEKIQLNDEETTAPASLYMIFDCGDFKALDGGTCTDTDGWKNEWGSGCSDYTTFGYCDGAGFTSANGWVEFDPGHRDPGANCCVCGKDGNTQDGTTQMIINNGVCLENEHWTDSSGNTKSIDDSSLNSHRQFVNAGTSQSPSMRILDLDSTTSKYASGSWQVCCHHIDVWTP